MQKYLLDNLFPGKMIFMQRGIHKLHQKHGIHKLHQKQNYVQRKQSHTNNRTESKAQDAPK